MCVTQHSKGPSRLLRVCRWYGCKAHLSNVFFFFTVVAFVYFTHRLSGIRPASKEGFEVGFDYLSIFAKWIDDPDMFDWKREFWSFYNDRQLRTIGAIACLCYARLPMLNEANKERATFWAELASPKRAGALSIQRRSNRLLCPRRPEVYHPPAGLALRLAHYRCLIRSGFLKLLF